MLFPGKKITGVFQPHLFSRTKDFALDFARELSFLDELILLDIYPAREKPVKGVTSGLILDQVTIEVKELIGKEELVNKLKEKEIEVLLTMGAGDIDRMVEPIENYLKEYAS
jgi:UDP-N-acetylmuramate--alanine ligase